MNLSPGDLGRKPTDSTAHQPLDLRLFGARVPAAAQLIIIRI